MDTPDSTSSLVNLQQAFDQAAYAFNRALVRLLIVAQNDLTVPPAEYDRALERLKDTRRVLNLLETWIVDHATS